MKILALNGSPRKKGNTSVLIQAVLEEIKNEGIETEEINIAVKNYRGCMDCRNCWKNHSSQCIIKGDDFNKTLNKMLEADGIILGSPVYIGDITGQLKNFLDRACYISFANGQIFKHKLGASVVSARRQGSISALNTLNSFFSTEQMPIVSSSYWNFALGLDKSDVKKDGEGLEVMRNLGRNMAWLLKSIEYSKNKIPKPDTPHEIVTILHPENVNILNVNR